VRNGADSDGCRVLIVEDNFLLAMEIETVLRRRGYVVLGPAGTVEGALAVLERDGWPDAAVLDVDLQGRRVTPVAAALRSRKVPLVLVTGYAEPQLKEPELQGLPRLDKPVSSQEVLSALSAALRGRPAVGPAQNRPTT
jgi:two-component system, response regulator PdtaR